MEEETVKPCISAQQVLADIHKMADALEDAGIRRPYTLHMPPQMAAMMELSDIDFGWWPMSVFRRQGARKVLLARFNAALETPQGASIFEP